MDKYKFFPHTADAKFQAFGQTLGEAFIHAALALSSLMWDWENVAKNIEIPVLLEGKDLEQLLKNFLEEILYLWDTQNFLLGSVNSISLENQGETWKIKALFVGDTLADEYEIFGDVKAVTYNEMIVNDKAPFMVQVVVDV
jgi:SHS2 domain-containing protein